MGLYGNGFYQRSRDWNMPSISLREALADFLRNRLFDRGTGFIRLLGEQVATPWRPFLEDLGKFIGCAERPVTINLFVASHQKFGII